MLLAAPEFEVLYGGAAGAGKSDALLIDALGLQQDAIGKRAYQAILFRRTYPDLKDLIDRSHDIYPAYGGDYDKQAHVWKFPSGARIEFGHMQYDSDRFKYRGRAFQYVGWDELTLFPTDVPYRYLLSRVRTSDPSIKCYVRATTNPDGPGFRWVKDYWRIQTEGSSTRFVIEVTDPETGEVTQMTRRFIAARLSDNPHLRDSGYRQTLLLLTEEEQNALLLGRWESPSIKGAYFAEQMEAARAGGRILNIPRLPHVPVNTFWDLGWNDTTAVWFHQHVGMEHRFIDFMEASGKDLQWFAADIQSKGYTYGKHYLPHDAENKTLAAGGKCIREILQELLPGHQFEVVPRTENLVASINQTRGALPSCYFDTDKCADGIAALEAYRREWDEKLSAYKQEPLHDWASNPADAFRQFAQGYPFLYAGQRKKASWRDRLKAKTRGSAMTA
ncbi:terminase [Solimonas sp. C16B3]|uniref:Terminase n=2 Tax=Solimonas marina TaxID=2714601 RepID=A0A969W8S8_9GAMM|nr:terminase family protein [Solimonas marina]NKF21588.1 terminase [Solimonas marina]